MLTVKVAQSLINQQAKSFGVELLPIENAQGRVLAEVIFTDRDYPPFNRAAMDGYAFKADEFLKKGILEYTVIEDIYAGKAANKKLSAGECYKIMTGSATPPDADTILRVEDTEQIGNKVIFKINVLKKGQNIAKRGEDKREGELVLNKNTLLESPELAVLAVLGETILPVYKLPTVTIISTGDEVVSAEQAVSPFQIRDSNSYALENFLKRYKIKIANKKLVSDNKELLSQTISTFLESDILIISGGVSMGDADFVPEVLTTLGVEKIFHKVAVKPGKPLWFGRSSRGVVFALPGNPMSVQVAYKIFIEPFVRKCFGLEELNFLKLPMAEKKSKKVKWDDYFPCSIQNENSSTLKPVNVNGSGDITSTLYSHGIALHEAERGDLKEGDVVRFYYWG